MPGGYGATSSTVTRPTARLASTVSLGAKNAVRGDMTVTGSTAYAAPVTTSRGGPRWRASEPRAHR